MKKALQNDIQKARDDVKKEVATVAKKFAENPTPFFEKRKSDLAKTLEQYGDISAGEAESLIALAMRPLPNLSKISGTVQRHSATTLQFTSDFYWTDLVPKLSEKFDFVANIYDLFSLLNISKYTFDSYLNGGDREIRETCEMILDRFIGYYQRKGMKKEISEIMSIFVLKTTYRQRENEAPSVVVANFNNVSADEKLKKLSNQYGFDDFEED